MNDCYRVRTVTMCAEKIYYRDCVTVRLFAVAWLSFGDENKCRDKQSFVSPVPASAVPDNWCPGSGIVQRREHDR